MALYEARFMLMLGVLNMGLLILPCIALVCLGAFDELEFVGWLLALAIGASVAHSSLAKRVGEYDIKSFQETMSGTLFATIFPYLLILMRRALIGVASGGAVAELDGLRWVPVIVLILLALPNQEQCRILSTQKGATLHTRALGTASWLVLPTTLWAGSLLCPTILPTPTLANLRVLLPVVVLLSLLRLSNMRRKFSSFEEGALSFLLCLSTWHLQTIRWRGAVSSNTEVKFGVNTCLHVVEVGIYCCCVCTVVLASLENVAHWRGSPGRKHPVVLALVFATFVVVLLVAMGDFLGMSFLIWLVELFLVNSYRNLELTLVWVALVCVCIVAAHLTDGVYGWSNTSTRKVFHFAAVAIFVPPLLNIAPCFRLCDLSVLFMPCDAGDTSEQMHQDYLPFLILAMGACLCLFAILEMVRYFSVNYCEVPIIGPSIDHYFQRFVNGTGSSDRPADMSREKDARKSVIIDHISLLVGCAGSVWLSGSMIMQPLCTTAHHHLVLLGSVYVGIGDAVGAIVGRNLGKTHWDATKVYSKRTVEGSLSALLSMALFVLIVEAWVVSSSSAGLESPLSLECWSSLGSCVVVTMLEALTPNNDNFVLPICGMVTYTSILSIMKST